MKQINSFSILCFILISVRVASISAQQCMNNGNFRPNSSYDENRRLILSSLPSSVKAQDGFFYNDSLGQEPNQVYAIGMCIPGSALDDCYVCIDTAFKGLIKSCPNQTDAYSWPGDPTLCLVRYSNTSFSGSADLDPHVLDSNAGDITSNLTEFKKIWEDLIGRMIAAASTARSTPSSSNNYYKADVAALTKVKNIYALMQCTPDISPGDCEKCLQRSVMEYQSCCGQKQGGVVLQPSCYFRWDLYPYSKAFDNITVTSPPPVAVPKPPGDQGNTTNNDSKGISAGVVVAITVPTIVIVLILLLAFVLFRKRKSYQEEGLLASWWFARRRRSYLEVELNIPGITTIPALQFKYKTIKAATNNFSGGNKIGQGGFGSVFKGTLPDGQEIAVKRLLRTSDQSMEDFKNEIVVAKLQHKNLVKLIGFSFKGEEKIIVYEFLPNKSLDCILFDPTRKGELDWTKRSKIIEGIARGILYLHRDSRLTIIHRDLKPGNILLDTDMNPRIADFGTAKIFGKDQTRAKTSPVGTPGYMPPEYSEEGQVSVKTDVYSFGVLVLQIICGKTNRSFSSPVSNLVTDAWRLWRNGSPLEFVDRNIAENHQSEKLTRCIHIALLCVQKYPEDRPDFSGIIDMLTINSFSLPVPKQPGCLVPQNNEGSQTINDVTITSLDPR